MQARYRTRAGLLLLVLALSALIDPRAEAMAQAACERELADAEQAYTFGRFDDAIRLLNQCLEKRTASEDERQRAFRLIGLSYIGKDLVNEARASIRRLLELVPDYRPDPDQDPPPFVEMIEEVRQEMQQEAVEPEPPPREEPEPTVRRQKGGVSKWLLIGGGAVLAGVAAAVLLSGGGGDGGDDGGPPEPTTLDEVEPNNSTAQAQVLRGNRPITVRGNVQVSDVGALEIDLSDFGIDDVDDLEDLYRVTLTAPGLRLTLSGLSADCDLYLLDAQASAYISNSIGEGTATETINEPNLAAGTYLIGVTIFDLEPLAQSTSYSLVVDGSVSGSSQRVAVERIHSLGGADVSNAFRLMAHPGDAPLAAALPDPADVAWTAYRDDGGALVEYDGTEAFRFRPGRGFWVQSDAPIRMEPAADAAPAASGDAVAVPLEAGWNIIANPFDAPLDWAAVQHANGVTQGLWRWDGRFVQADTFEPARRGEAYYFMNLTHLEALTIPHPNAARARPATRPERPFALTLSAYREGRPASAVRAGFADGAAPGFDGYDQLAPPGYFEAASLRLIRDVSSERRLVLADEFRPWDDAGHQFDLVLKAPAHAPIEVHTDGLEAFTGLDVYLIDREKAVAYDLHAHPVLSLTPGEALSRYRLVVGTEAFARGVRGELAPEAVHLSNYPNPFNPRTRITYTVPASAAQEPVRLEVYDVAGHRVRVLVDSVQDPGTHHVEWDGTDASGAPVASGLYLYRLRTGPHTHVRKMLLTK